MDMRELLEVQKKSRAFVEDIYRVTNRYPEHELRGIARQMQNASVSIVSNVVEGRARATRKDYAHFVNIAYASAKELESQIQLSGRIGYLINDEEQRLLSDIDEILRMLWCLNIELAIP